MLSHRVTDTEDRRAMSDQRTDTTRGVHIEELAECLYETAVLCGQGNVAEDAVGDWHRLSPSGRSKYRFEAVAALNRLSPARKYEAELRAREQVADAHYGRAFHLLPPSQQREIVHRNRTAINTANNVLEGHFSILHPSVVRLLEPAVDLASTKRVGTERQECERESQARIQQEFKR